MRNLKIVVLKFSKEIQNQNNQIIDMKLNLQNIKSNNSELTEHIHKLLTKYAQIIAKHEMDSGMLKTLPDCEFTLTIRKDLGPITPYQGKGIPLKEAHRKEIQRQFNKMMDYKIIEKSTSDWAHDVFAVGKKTGDVRIVFEFRPINSVTNIKTKY